MFVIREVFIAKPGQASKLAAVFKDALSTIPRVRARVLTDYVGDFNTVVFETEVEQLAEFDAIMKEYASSSELRERMRGYTELWQSGRREIFRVA